MRSTCSWRGEAEGTRPKDLPQCMPARLPLTVRWEAALGYKGCFALKGGRQNPVLPRVRDDTSTWGVPLLFTRATHGTSGATVALTGADARCPVVSQRPPTVSGHGGLLGGCLAQLALQGHICHPLHRPHPPAWGQAAARGQGVGATEGPRGKVTGPKILRAVACSFSYWYLLSRVPRTASSRSFPYFHLPVCKELEAQQMRAQVTLVKIQNFGGDCLAPYPPPLHPAAAALCRSSG